MHINIKAHVSPHHIEASHNAHQARAAAIVTGLRALNKKEANALADQIVAKLESTGKETAAVHQAMADRKTLKKAAQTTAANLKAGISGVYALVAADHVLAAQLPVRADLATLDDDTLARRVSEAIGINKRGATLAEFLVATADAARTANQTLQAVIDGEDAVRQGHAALTELSMMLLQGVALIRRNAKPGSPAWAALKRKKKPAVAAHPDPTPAPTPAPHPAPVVVEPKPVPSTPIAANGVHA